MSDETTLMKVDSERCGKLRVYIQGNLKEKQGKTVFLTVHDLGTNHRSWIRYINHPSCADLKAHGVFLHVCLPGQDDSDDDLAESYPSLSEIGEELYRVLDEADVRTCVAMGDGAGANIVCRFAMARPNRVMGVALIHPTSTTAGVIESLKDKVLNWQMSGGTLSQAAQEYLIAQKFGPDASKDSSEHVSQYTEELKKLNMANLSKLLESFQKRTDLSAELTPSMNTESLLVVGGKASYLHTTYTMHQAMPKDKATLLVVDGVGDVLTEAADRYTRALILFCKGCGMLSGVPIPGMERQRTLSSSMEEADRPRKSSVTAL